MHQIHANERVQRVFLNTISNKHTFLTQSLYFFSSRSVRIYLLYLARYHRTSRKANQMIDEVDDIESRIRKYNIDSPQFLKFKVTKHTLYVFSYFPVLTKRAKNKNITIIYI